VRLCVGPSVATQRTQSCVSSQPSGEARKPCFSLKRIPWTLAALFVQRLLERARGRAGRKGIFRGPLCYHALSTSAADITAFFTCEVQGKDRALPGRARKEQRAAG